MAQKRRRPPNRNATRGASQLRVVSRDGVALSPSPATAAGGHPGADDDPAVSLPGLLAAIAAPLLAEVDRARTPLAAELALCRMFGTLARGLPGDEPDEVDTAIATLLGQLVDHLSGQPTEQALALMRVCSGLGPEASRAHARAAAERLAAAGVRDRPWVRDVGRPEMLRAWRTTAVFEPVESIGVLFSYRGREHALSVLIDHELGGGVKDCWVAEGRDASGLRDRSAAAVAAEELMELTDLDTATVATILSDALAEEPVPNDEDQVEDVEDLLHLVRARTERLCELAGLPLPSAPTRETDPADSDDVVQLKVALRDVKPPVWRRLEVPAGITLARLHHVLQTAFDWTDSHLHCFELDGPGRAVRTLEGAALRRTRLRDVAGRPGDRLVYRYDFGDDWEHVITVEDRRPADPDLTYPRCTAGRRAAPPEDCGGAWGYQDLMAALADPGHPEHEQLSEWAPPGFDPAAFDRTGLNARLAPLG